MAIIRRFVLSVALFVTFALFVKLGHAGTTCPSPTISVESSALAAPLPQRASSLVDVAQRR